jgi:hypothetical protein
MMSPYSPYRLEPLSADDCSYASQNVSDEMSSKDEFMAFIVPKLKTIKRPGFSVHAEMGHMPEPSDGARSTVMVTETRAAPCVVIAQGEKDNVLAVVFAEVVDDRVKRLDMCSVAPDPKSAIRSGRYPR